MRKDQTTIPRAPRHLSEAMRAWFNQVQRDYQLEAHHTRLLVMACEAHDRATSAREALATFGLVYVNRLGEPRPRPEAAILRDAVASYARLLRELDLDAEATPEAPRPPALRRNRR